METPLYTQSGEYLGHFDESYLRPLISKREARFTRTCGDRRVILTTTETPHRVRALSGSEHGSALSTVCTENLYPESPARLAVMRDNGIRPDVTATVLTLKKFRTGIGFVPYGETDTFAMRRFNPDKIRTPLFGSEKQAREAIAQLAMNAGRWVATDRGAFDPAETPVAVSFVAENQPAAFSIGDLMSDAQLVLWYEFRGTLPVQYGV